ncbi:MAG: class I tRNA ligase family protein, partial [Halieaceae bacterium]
HTEGHDLLKARGTPSLADRWIRSRLQSTLLAVDDAVAAYRFDLAAQSLYDFVWNEFCDWYLELSKPVLWDEAGHPQALLGTRQTLAEVLEQALRMLHPFMPFVTEEIWQSVSPLTGTTGDSIMLAPWPTPEPEHTDLDAEDEIEWMKGIIVAIRTIRSEANIPPATTLEVTVANTSALDRDRLQRNGTYLQRLSKSASIIPIENHEAETASLMALFGELEVRVPMAGLVDVTAELTRLDKEIAKAEAEKARLNGKLTNAKFIERAPADIVAAERQKLTQVDASLKVLQQQRRQIEELRSD